jgi:primosomal protein N' (replication factor Y)
VGEILAAEVAVPVPIEGTLTYLVPPGMRDAVEVGMRVVVPVRGKLLTGVIVSLGQGTKGGRELKAIREPADDRPVVTPELRNLAGWISDYYLSPLGEVLATMSPPPVGLSRVYRLRSSPTDLEMEIIKASDPQSAEILGVLADGRPRSYAALRRRVGAGDLRVRLGKLEDQGHITHNIVARKRRGGRTEDQEGHLRDASPDVPGPELTPFQQAAYDGIGRDLDGGVFGVSLILGVTGSGKTEVYLRLIEHAVEMGKRAIYLVPEIGLTPQIMARVRERFGGRSAVLHSRLTRPQRYTTWQRILDGEIDVVVGARSAVFAPVENLGIVVVDEEHDTSYKQQESPRYNARDVAIVRARRVGAVVVLGSATPTIESYHKALDGKYGLYELPERISGGALPEVRVVDMRSVRDSDSFSREAEEAIRSSVLHDEQVLLFVNRRGFSNYVQCRDCGLVPRCRNCYVSLTYHSGRKDLRCHYCDYSERGFDTCPKCGSTDILYVGLGTQRVEDYVAEHFPGVTCARFDRDATRRKGSTEALLNDFSEGVVRFLVGTQMVAKGHDFKRVGLVVVVNADVSMNLPDFRAGERTFQILTQVAGRAGRGDIPGRVVIQTFNPDHHSLAYVTGHDFKGFYTEETAMRRELRYPPFARLVRVLVEAPRHAAAQSAAQAIARTASRLGKRAPGQIDVVGPSRAPLSKIKNLYRWHLMIKGGAEANVSALVKRALDALSPDDLPERVRIHVDVDPQVMI